VFYPQIKSVQDSRRAEMFSGVATSRESTQRGRSSNVQLIFNDVI